MIAKIASSMPKGTFAVFFIQMFSTLSFAVLYSTLVLYATSALHLSDTTATAITASFVAFNYALHLISGYVGGRFFSYRTLFSIGMVSMLVGCLCISIPNVNVFYWGLTVFLIGSGFNVTCINCMLSQLFQEHDKKRDTAFLLNYSSMNVGAFIGFFVSGYFQLHLAYSELFMLSSIGNLAAIFFVFKNWRYLSDINTVFSGLTRKGQIRSQWQGIAMVAGAVLILHSLLFNAQMSNRLIIGVAVAMGIIFTWLAGHQNPRDRDRIFAYLIFALMALVFWSLYMLAPMSLTLFIQRNVDRHYLGLLIAPQWVQNINTFVIIIGGPILSIFFSYLRQRGVNFSFSLQFAIALLMAGIGFAVLPIGIYFANDQGYSSFNWIILSFIFQSMGELFIGPMGYAMVGQLAPVKLRAIMLGAWSMITGVAAVFSSFFSKLSLGATDAIDPLSTNASFSHVFLMLGVASIALGLFVMFCIPFLSRLTYEKMTPVPA